MMNQKMVDQSTPRGNGSSTGGNGGSRWVVLAGVAAVTAVAATGYLLYGYSTGWKGAAYSFWCPNKNKKRKVNSPFYSQINQSSNALEAESRAWMERYVQTSLMKSNNSKKSNAKNKRGKVKAAYQSMAAENGDEDETEEDGQVKRKRKNSYIREGTGRYAQAEALGDCIATEKGLLKREGFQHIQKIIEVYSKGLLLKMRQQHHEERRVAYLNQDWTTYADIIMKQQAKEIKVFNGATLEVLSLANIQTSVFNKSVELHMITSHDNLL